MEVAIENCPEPFGFLMKNAEQFSKFFTELDDELGLVLDVGHSNINDQTHAFIKTFRSRITHIHAHDNRGDHDHHFGIGYGSVDWNQFAEEIKQSAFQGLIIVESFNHLQESIQILRKLFS
jgi:sugar phosphate isomerase/epimerase